jgi:M6 family metalloprotease-like protein
VPVFLAMYANTDSAWTEANLPRDSMERRLYGTQTAPPYSVHSYYREISNDHLSIYGTVLPWTRADSSDTYYQGPTRCNGLCGSAHVADLIREMVQAHDTAVDYGQFDGDGDGYVDAVVIIHPEVDGSCLRFVTTAADSNNIWAHRWTYAGWTGQDLVTNDGVRVRDYIIQGGQGGDALPEGRGGCEAGKPQAMGVVAHETGHLFGLPDLYDTRSSGGEGIGRWGIMGSGNQQVSFRPVHMEAWSRAELGWVTEVVVTNDTVLEITPIEASDTAYVLPLAGSNEYFLLENRQRIGSDSMLIEPGLLIWHVDSARIAARWPFNTVNSASPYGLALEQADGLGQLETVGLLNRGDPGDPFPGSTTNRWLAATTVPSSARNDGAATYAIVDCIESVPGSSIISARVGSRRPSLIQATDTLAEFQLDGVSYRRFDGVVGPCADHTISMELNHSTADGSARFTWVSWSDGLPPAHGFTASADGDTLIATVDADYLLRVTLAGPAPAGSVTLAPAVGDVAAGVFVNRDSTVTLTATPPSGMLFAGWSGDTTATSATLPLTMTRPLRLTATFVAAPLLADFVRHVTGVAETLGGDQIVLLDRLGNANGRADLGDFLAWVRSGSSSLTAAEAAALLARFEVVR